MKKVILSVLVIIFSLISCKKEVKKPNTNQNEHRISINTQESTFGVRGNCGMCKKTIEKAAKSLEGVNSAAWDKYRKHISVSYNKEKINILAIHKAIAASGYDTDKSKGSDSAYENLPDCCKYNREMDMSIQGDVKETGDTH